MDASIARARSKQFLERSQAMPHFANTQLQNRMNRVRGDRDQGIQNEGPLVHPWMRHGQSRLLNDAVPIEQKVNIQGPWRIADKSLSIAGALDRQHRVQQVLRLEGSLDSDTRVAEYPAARAVHGLSLKQRGTR